MKHRSYISLTKGGGQSDDQFIVSSLSELEQYQQRNFAITKIFAISQIEITLNSSSYNFYAVPKVLQLNNFSTDIGNTIVESGREIFIDFNSKASLAIVARFDLAAYLYQNLGTEGAEFPTLPVYTINNLQLTFELEQKAI